MSVDTCGHIPAASGELSRGNDLNASHADENLKIINHYKMFVRAAWPLLIYQGWSKACRLLTEKGCSFVHSSSTVWRPVNIWRLEHGCSRWILLLVVTLRSCVDFGSMELWCFCCFAVMNMKNKGFFQKYKVSLLNIYKYMLTICICSNYLKAIKRFLYYMFLCIFYPVFFRLFCTWDL